MAELEHGGVLSAARRRYPDAPRPFLDLSTGINPTPYPLPPIPPEAWTRLPDPEDLARLEAAAAAAYGARDPAMVVAAPGTQALIALLPRLFPARCVAVVSPTYGEHAACWAISGAEVREVATPDGLAGADVAVVCSPNNPDGRRVSFARHREASTPWREGSGGGLLIVDEAFADLEPDFRSAVPALAEDDRAIVLRSFGKSYGLAGLRLGFAVAPLPLASRIRHALGPWPVSGPALAVGTAALADTEWRRAAAARCLQGAGRLDDLLGAAGFQLLGGTSLFRLAGAPDAAARAERLGRAGILVRRFAANPSWLRFGLAGDETAWRRLQAALLER